MSSEEYDWQTRTEFTKALLKLRTAQSGYPHVEEDTTRRTLARQVIQCSAEA
jgi:hypothetical protein